MKPKLSKQKLEGKQPPKEANKGKRKVYQQGRWQEADIWQMEKLRPGNEIDLPEHLVPTDKRVVVTASAPERRMVYEFNGRPARGVYEELTGVELQSLPRVDLA